MAPPTLTRLPAAVARRARSTPALRLPIVTYRHRRLVAADVFLASYPKSGNTWLKFMLASLLAGREIGFDHEPDLVPPVGAHARAGPLLADGGRLVKSHEPYSALYVRSPRRAIYVLRDGRDAAVSYYYAFLRRGWYDGPFSGFLGLFLAGRVDGYGTWERHVRSWLSSPLAGDGGLLLVRYEDLLEDARGELGRVAGFLGVEARTEELDRAVERNTIERMRSREQGSRFQKRMRRKHIPFVRKGVAGDWTATFSPDDHARFLRAAGDLLADLGYARDDDVARGGQHEAHAAS